MPLSIHGSGYPPGIVTHSVGTVDMWQHASSEDAPTQRHTDHYYSRELQDAAGVAPEATVMGADTAIQHMLGTMPLDASPMVTGLAMPMPMPARVHLSLSPFAAFEGTHSGDQGGRSGLALTTAAAAAGASQQPAPPPEFVGANLADFEGIGGFLPVRAADKPVACQAVGQQQWLSGCHTHCVVDG